jgi:hypothetical protein
VYQVWLKSLQAFQSYARTYTHTHIHLYIYIYIYIYIRAQGACVCGVYSVLVFMKLFYTKAELSWRFSGEQMYRYKRSHPRHKFEVRPGRLLSRKIASSTHRIGEWVDHRTGVDDLGRSARSQHLYSLCYRCCYHIYKFMYLYVSPLRSIGQSSWLQIQRSEFDSRCHQIFWEVVDLERGPLSLVSTLEELTNSYV